jgi:TrmH family RNA methyltransferase
MITSLANAKVKYVRRLQSERRFRGREQAFVVEGNRWLTEFLQTTQSPSLILHTAVWQDHHASILQQLNAPSQLVSDEVMAAISDTETPSGVVAVVPIQPQPLPQQPTLLLVLDNVTNPGNLGTILRSAAAAGADGVLLGPGCVDAYNPKVVRGGMGAHLRLPVHHVTWDKVAKIGAGMFVWLATAEGEYPYTTVSWQQPSAIIIGGEASGPGPEARELANGRIRIPMHNQTESLNAAVAASVILFEAARQRQKNN